MMSSRIKDKHILLKIVIGFVMIVLTLIILRAFHVILHIGNEYTVCFRNEWKIDDTSKISDDNIKEIVYMKKLNRFTSINAQITNYDFLADFTELESIYIHSNALATGIVINDLPSLQKSSNLEYAFLYIDLDNLDCIANSNKLKDLTVSPYDAEIHSISGLKNKPELKGLILKHIHCSDYSVLLELPSLEYLQIDGSELPDEIKTALEEKGVEVKETPKEELQKEREEYEELVKSHQVQND